MSSISTAEAALVEVIRKAEAAMKLVGQTELSAALADLDAAQNDARARLEEGARRARDSFACIARDTQALADKLSADLFGAPVQAAPVAPVVAEQASEPAVEAGPVLATPPIAQEAPPATEVASPLAPVVEAVPAFAVTLHAPAAAPIAATGRTVADALRSAISQTEKAGADGTAIAEPETVTTAANAPVDAEPAADATTPTKKAKRGKATRRT